MCEKKTYLNVLSVKAQCAFVTTCFSRNPQIIVTTCGKDSSFTFTETKWRAIIVQYQQLQEVLGCASVFNAISEEILQKWCYIISCVKINLVGWRCNNILNQMYDLALGVWAIPVVYLNKIIHVWAVLLSKKSG